MSFPIKQYSCDTGFCVRFEPRNNLAQYVEYKTFRGGESNDEGGESSGGGGESSDEGGESSGGGGESSDGMLHPQSSGGGAESSGRMLHIESSGGGESSGRMLHPQSSGGGGESSGRMLHIESSGGGESSGRMLHMYMWTKDSKLFQDGNMYTKVVAYRSGSLNKFDAGNGERGWIVTLGSETDVLEVCLEVLTILKGQKKRKQTASQEMDWHCTERHEQDMDGHCTERHGRYLKRPKIS